MAARLLDARNRGSSSKKTYCHYYFSQIIKKYRIRIISSTTFTLRNVLYPENKIIMSKISQSVLKGTKYTVRSINLHFL